MDITQAVQKRHRVRKYKDIPLPDKIIEKLNGRIEKNNKMYGLNIKLMTNDEKAIGAIVKFFLAKGVKNYFILAGNEAACLTTKWSNM